MSDTSHRILVLLTGVVLSVIGIVSGIMGWWGQVAIVMWFGIAFFLAGIFTLAIFGLAASAGHL